MVLKAYWPLNGDLKDVRGSNDGTNNGVTFTAGLLGEQSGNFNSSEGDYIDISSFDTSSNNIFSWSFWMHDESQSSAIRRWLVTTTGQFTTSTVCVRENNGEIQIYNGNNSLQTSGHSWKGGWHQYTLVSDGTTLKLYEDNEELLSGSTTVPETGLFIGGYYNGGEYTEGKIQHVRIYDHALTKQEIQYLYQVGERGLHTSDRRSL